MARKSAEDGRGVREAHKSGNRGLGCGFLLESGKKTGVSNRSFIVLPDTIVNDDTLSLHGGISETKKRNERKKPSYPRIPAKPTKFLLQNANPAFLNLQLNPLPGFYFLFQEVICQAVFDVTFDGAF